MARRHIFGNFMLFSCVELFVVFLGASHRGVRI